MDEAKIREVLQYCHNQANNTLAGSIHGDEIQQRDEYEEALYRIRDKIEELTDDDMEDVQGKYSLYAVFPDGTRRLLQSNLVNSSQAEMRQGFWQQHYRCYGATVEIQERKT